MKPSVGSSCSESDSCSVGSSNQPSLVSSGTVAITTSPTISPTTVPTEDPSSLAPLIGDATASICIISSIPSRFNQSEWSGTDAALAMKQAIALTMGQPVDAIEIGYASQLCLTSPTTAPSISPTQNPTVQPSTASFSGRRLLQNAKDVSLAAILSMSKAIGNHDMTIDALSIIPLSFSIYKALPGNQ